ncbi:MAG: pyrroloquinoline quinone biosynthesis protein PqqE, partial [Micromonosporaceae bacterium]|nr:pyrroloquinoline quinone biosynthesis protein PqqE [Micromonosporaceae bacterium]
MTQQAGLGLRRGVRLVHDPVRQRSALLYPEGVLLLNDTATAIVERCDGRRRAEQILADLSADYDRVSPADVRDLLSDLDTRRLLATDGTGLPVEPRRAAGVDGTARSPAPLGLLAELTYRCPLHCAYCANPLNLTDYRDELSTADWIRVLGQARDLGVLQVHFSGGEPLLRPDLPELVDHAHQLGMYVNLVTSGIPLSAGSLSSLVDAGLDHFQLSIQDDRASAADSMAGMPAHARKLAVAAQVREYGLPLTINAVLHRGNIERLAGLTELAVTLRADRLELAHTQFYGWALPNRAALMPTEEQVRAAQRAVAAARRQYGDRIEIVYVAADYHTGTAKPCMDGWGNRQLVIAPNGDVLPCLAAAQLPGLEIPSARRAELHSIWYDSAAFNAFRGTDWMPEPCRSCSLRTLDFGGCRCQAYQLVGDPAATDPACRLSPHHNLIAELRAPA